jgi:hypothetical protein
MQMTKIVLDNDGRIYAAPNVKTLVRTIYKASTIFDGSRNVREWMEGIAERGQTGGFTKSAKSRRHLRKHFSAIA